jgi:hypothetical protein
MGGCESEPSNSRVDILPPMQLIGSDVIKVVNNLGFLLNGRLTVTDHFKKVCQKIFWILRSFRPPLAPHTLFEVRKRLIVSLIMPHIGYGGILYAGAEATSQRGYDFKSLFTVHSFSEKA